MQSTPFNVSSDFSKEIMKKYRRLLREESWNNTHQQSLDSELEPVESSRPASAARQSPEYPTQDLQSVTASELDAQPVGTEKEYGQLSHYQRDSPVKDFYNAPHSPLYADIEQRKHDSTQKVHFTKPNRLEIGRDVYHDTYSMDTSMTDLLKAEHASIVRAIKQRAQEQILQAHKERDMAINEARESSLTYMQKIDQLESLLMAKENAIKSLQGDMVQLKDLYDTRQQNMMDRQVKLEQENESYREEIRSLQTRLEQTREHERATLQEKVKLATDANMARIETLENKLRLAEKSISNLERDKLSILQETAKDITEMNRCHEELRTRYAELVIMSKKLKQKAIVASSERNALKEENEALLDELSGLRERNENLSKELIRADRLVFGKPRNSSGVRL